jgi:hypothetical protein
VKRKAREMATKGGESGTKNTKGTNEEDKLYNSKYYIYKKKGKIKIGKKN